MEFLSDIQTKAVLGAVDAERNTIRAVCRHIFRFQEVMFQERQSALYLCNLLESRGFQVARPAAGLETAFRAECSFGRGPRLGLLAEYDALPQLGHACGHNLIAAGAVGAALALAALAEAFSGTLVVFGTPAEEGGGGKVTMAAAGLFDDMDAVVYYHPSVRDDLYGPTLACQMHRVAFQGRQAHVQLNPEEGRNALTAVVNTISGLQQEQKQFHELSRIGSIVTEGGQNPIIIPGRAAGEFLLSAADDLNCNALASVLNRVVQRAAADTLTRAEIEKVMHYPSVRLNRQLTRVIAEQMQHLGLKPAEPSLLIVSTDCGAVSRRCPFGAFRLRLGQPPPYPHTLAFAELAGGTEGEDNAFLAARIQALTLYALFNSEDGLRSSQREFQDSQSSP